jgi:hypothetical protein
VKQTARGRAAIAANDPKQISRRGPQTHEQWKFDLLPAPALSIPEVHNTAVRVCCRGQADAPATHVDATRMTRNGHSIDSAHERAGLPAIVELKLRKADLVARSMQWKHSTGASGSGETINRCRWCVADRADADAFGQRSRGVASLIAVMRFSVRCLTDEKGRDWY